ncbi:MAG: hypothetical protein KAR06_04665, partial [Deltaproteobacteria bacterium]|nr:hypothetical protein [Deltaproteobacteria bacterium]
MPNVVQRSFAGGEVSPALYGRVDQTKYATGLKTCRNFIVQRHGGAANRPGTNFIAEVNDSTKTVKFIPFIFNALQTYVLEFGDLYMRVHKNGVQQREAAKNITGITQANPCVVTVTGHGYSTGDEVYITGVEGMTELNTRNFKIVHAGANAYSLQFMDGTPVDSTAFTAYTSQGTSEKVFEITTTYLEADLPTLQYVQSADIVTLVHPSYPPRELARTGDISWTITDVTFGPTIEAPTNPASGGPGTNFKYKVTALDAETGEESLASPTFGSTGRTQDLTWDAIAGASSYNI